MNKSKLFNSCILLYIQCVGFFSNIKIPTIVRNQNRNDSIRYTARNRNTHRPSELRIKTNLSQSSTQNRSKSTLIWSTGQLGQFPFRRSDSYNLESFERVRTPRAIHTKQKQKYTHESQRKRKRKQIVQYILHGENKYSYGRNISRYTHTHKCK